MPRVGFEPTIPAFQRTKTVHALDSAATVIGNVSFLLVSNTEITEKENFGDQFFPELLLTIHYHTIRRRFGSVAE
jgi:hypothetical protein